jgi:hypothetical protein
MFLLMLICLFKFSFRVAAMASFSLRERSMLEGASNFEPWKCKLQNLLEEIELWYIVDMEVTSPTNPKNLVEYTKEIDQGKANHP